MNILFVINTTFPFGTAYSSRAFHLVKLLKECGHHIHIIALTEKAVNFNEERLGADYSCYYVNDPKSIFTLAGIGTAKPYLEKAILCLSKIRIDIIMSNGMPFVSKKLLVFSRKYTIPYVVDNCEWYDASSFKGGKFNPYYREHLKMLISTNKKLEGMIVISRLLQNHYSQQRLLTIRIPTILDMNAITSRKSVKRNNVISIIFAGNLGKGKENLRPMLEALQKVNSKKKRVHFHIYGPTEQQIYSDRYLDHKLLNEVSNFISIHGPVSQQNVSEFVKSADYSFFFRPRRKSSDAGFPTKLAESMMVGTPVITNNTGDIELYISSGNNGFLIEDDSTVALINILDSIINMSTESMVNMRVAARNTAEEFFDYRKYCASMNKFLNLIVRNYNSQIPKKL